VCVCVCVYKLSFFRIAGFTEYYPFKHEDFDVNSKTYKIFHIHEYNWSDHGYALINAFYEDGELASLLDKQFDIIYHLTDNSIGMNANVDTSIFRRVSILLVCCAKIRKYFAT